MTKSLSLPPPPPELLKEKSGVCIKIPRSDTNEECADEVTVTVSDTHKYRWRHPSEAKTKTYSTADPEDDA